MNIGFSTFLLHGGQTGIATYIRELLRILQQEDGENRYDLLMARTDAGLLPLVSPRFRQVLLPSFLNAPLPNLVWHNTALAAAGRKYDLLHIPSARRIPLFKRTRVVATVHDLAAFTVEAKYGPARMAFNRTVVPAMIRRADHVIAVSHFTKQDIVRHTGYPEERISVIYSGIDRTLFHPIQPDEARAQLEAQYGVSGPFFVYISRLEHPGKNHVRLIDAFERFKLANDSAHRLVLAGADWHGADAIRARAAQSPVKDDILFLGFVPAATLPLLYSACDLMVFPSLFEGFGFPVLEALACGAPVACSDGSSMREIADGWLPVFDPRDPETIFRCMESAVSGGWSLAMRQRAVEYAGRFDWRNTARATMEVYRQTAGAIHA